MVVSRSWRSRGMRAAVAGAAGGMTPTFIGAANLQTAGPKALSTQATPIIEAL